MKTTSPKALIKCAGIWYDLFKMVTPDAASIIISNNAWINTFMARKVSSDNFYSILPCIKTELENVT